MIAAEQALHLEPIKHGGHELGRDVPPEGDRDS
jgi:hypothetical protein